ncbi:MAG: FMN-binding protein [Clostridia bacterium]|nr:FMN-binding protein [Clostridia bacterium]
MTAKQFFHGKAFKCIIVILIIVLVCGIFLAFCDSLFAVSDEERTSRAMSKLYDEEVTAHNITDDIPDEVETEMTYSTVKAFYSVENGDYVVQIAGKQGYGGSVTCWVVVQDDGTKVTGIGTVIAQSSENTGESFLSNLGDEDFERFSVDYEDGIVYDYGFANDTSTTHGEGYVSTGASKSYRGVCNAVNGAIDFVNSYLEYLAASPVASEEVAA